MWSTSRWNLTASSTVLALALAASAAAQTFSLPVASTLTRPDAAPGRCAPFYSLHGDIYSAPAPPLMVAPFGPPGCGLGMIDDNANVDAFSSNHGPFPVVAQTVPPGLLFIRFSVGPAATGDADSSVACLASQPGPFPPDVGHEACAVPKSSDAMADIFETVGSNPAFLPALLPGSMPHTQLYDGNGAAPGGCDFLPLPPSVAALGLREPSTEYDGVAAFDGASVSSWDSNGDGTPDEAVYFSLDEPSASFIGSQPGDVFMTVHGTPAIYALATQLGLDAGGPGTDDLNALTVFDSDGDPTTFNPAVDIVLFSVGRVPDSAIAGTPNPCPGPLAGTSIEYGDILTEGTQFGAPGQACILVPAENINLWTVRTCGPKPKANTGGDNVTALDAAVGAPPPTPTPTAVPTCTPAGTPVPAPTPVTKAELKCQQAIAQAASKFVSDKTKALQKCHDDLLKGKTLSSGATDPGPGGGGRLFTCSSDPKTGMQISKAVAKLQQKVLGKCLGLPPLSVGYFTQCPDFESAGCPIPIGNEYDVATCIECIGEAAVDQAMELFYDDMLAGAPPDVLKCQRTIGKEASKFLIAKEKILRKCWDASLKGKHALFCPDPFAPPKSEAKNAADKIAKADLKKVIKICKACGGGDKQCDPTITLLDGSWLNGAGTGDDFTATQIGAPPTCPNVVVPYSGLSCAGSVAGLNDLIECLDCVSEFKVDCVDAARVPELLWPLPGSPWGYPCECN